MKKLLGIIVLGLFFSSTANSSWLSKKPSLFGIELGSNISNYTQKKCLTEHNYEKLKTNNFLNLDLSKKDKTGPQWTKWFYSQSKLPVSDGCIESKVENNDFFNYEVQIFPKTKEIYNISALYKRVYKYSKSDLKNKIEFYDLSDIKIIDPNTGKPKEEKKKRIKFNISGTQCDDRAYELIKIIIKSQKKKGYRFDKVDKGYGLYTSDFGSFTWEVDGQKGSDRESRIRILAECSMDGIGSHVIVNDDYDESTIQNFLVRVSIGYQHYKTNSRVEKEEDILKEEMRGNKNKSLNTDGL